MQNKDDYTTQELNLEEFIYKTNTENTFLLKLKEISAAKKKEWCNLNDRHRLTVKKVGIEIFTDWIE